MESFNHKCLTKCYPKNKKYLHPILLTVISDPNNDSCAIYPTYNKDSKYFNNQNLIVADKCVPSKIVPDELENILLTFSFNPKDFLNNIYDLNNFNDVIFWSINNDYLPFNTIKRVQNCAWKSFVSKVSDISDLVFEYYFEIAQKYWLPLYIKNIESNYSFDILSNDKINYSKADDEIKNIINKYFNYHFFIISIKKFIDKYNWNNIESPYDSIKDFIFNQLIKKIKS